MDAVSLIQTAAVAVALLGLCFFAFFGAYYVRNRRIALSRGEQVGSGNSEHPPPARADGAGSARVRDGSMGASERKGEGE